MAYIKNQVIKYIYEGLEFIINGDIGIDEEITPQQATTNTK